MNYKKDDVVVWDNRLYLVMGYEYDQHIMLKDITIDNIEVNYIWYPPSDSDLTLATKDSFYNYLYIIDTKMARYRKDIDDSKPILNCDDTRWLLSYLLKERYQVMKAFEKFLNQDN